MAGFNDLLMRLLAQDKASPVLKNAQRNVNSFGQAVGGVNKVLGAFGVALGGAAIVSGLANLTRLGAQAETVGQSFDNLARSTGLASKEMIGSLRQASRGAISDMELMQAANKAMIMGGEQMGRALPQLLELARAASIALGEDMQYMFSSIVTGIARQSPLILDNLGLIVDMPTAYKAYADSVGKAVTHLTEQEKMTALLNDVLRITPDYINKVGAEAITSAEKVAGFETSLKNLREEAAKAIAGGGGADLAEFGAKLFASFSETAEVKRLIAEIRAIDEEAAYRFSAQQQIITRLKPTFTEADVDEKRRELEELRVRLEAFITAEETAANAQRRMNQAMEASSALLRGLIPGTDSYWVAVERLGKSAANTAVALRMMATAQADPGYIRQMNAATGFATAMAWYQNQVTNPERLKSKDYRPSYVYASDYLGGLGYQQGEAKRAGEQAGASYASGFNSQINAIQSKIQSALGSRMTPSQTDFLKTAMGTYENAPLESVRQLDAILARGFAEIKAHPDWAAMLKIPEDVLAGSELGLKAWAADTRDAAAAMARPDLIDWDAFLKEFDKLSAIESGQQAVYQQAWDYLKSTGRLGNQAQSEGILRSMFGLDSPEAQGKALGQSLTTAFSASDPAGVFLNTFRTGTDQRKTEFENAGKALGKLVGKPVGEKILDEIAASMTGGQFTVTVAVNKAAANTTGGGYQALP